MRRRRMSRGGGEGGEEGGGVHTYPELYTAVAVLVIVNITNASFDIQFLAQDSRPEIRCAVGTKSWICTTPSS